jgi:hypothetical protein
VLLDVLVNPVSIGDVVSHPKKRIDQAVRIQCGVVHLAEPEWALLPVGHLLPLTKGLSMDELDKSCESLGFFSLFV